MSLVLLILCVGLAEGSVTKRKPAPEALPPTKLLLNDLSPFRPTGANWKIVGDVYADLHTEQAMDGRPGKGILANLSDPKNRAHLFTRFEHGDIEIEMEVMMPKGSNSGIYLQGRYELQLFDSWGRKEMRYSDMGGVYQRTDTSTNKGYEGHAPLLNACKAPGLWQKLKIIFKAPEFDARGKKIADARFMKVYLNGVVVQDDVPVSGPTRSAAFTDERPLGPLMIQGNHGRVAFRNITYKLYDRKTVGVRDLVYTEYKTPGDSMKGLSSLKPLYEKKVDSISRQLATQKDVFLMTYHGRFEFPKAGVYLFTMQAGGGGMLVINRDTVILHDGGAHGFDEKALGLYTARAGMAPFVLVYNKPQYREGFALYVEGPGIATHPLHSKGSEFHEPPVDPILISASPGKAVIQRSFMNSREGKRTHCLSVGTPQGINFSVDLETGNLLEMWDGGFLDATAMWHKRGNQQIGIPLGPAIEFPDKPNFIATPKFLEYTVEANGLPDFRYSVGARTISDKIVPSAGERGITRKVLIDGEGTFSYTLASGSVVDRLPDGSFLVNDKEYYLVTHTAGLHPEIKKSGGSQAIVVSGKSPGPFEFEYTLLW